MLLKIADDLSPGTPLWKLDSARVSMRCDDRIEFCLPWCIGLNMKLGLADSLSLLLWSSLLRFDSMVCTKLLADWMRFECDGFWEAAWSRLDIICLVGLLTILLFCSEVWSPSRIWFWIDWRSLPCFEYLLAEDGCPLYEVGLSVWLINYIFQ